MKTTLASLAFVAVSAFTTPQVEAAQGFTAEQLCKAGLALAIDKKPRGIKVTPGASNQRILLDVKDGSKDWDYRCEVNRGNKTIKLNARDIKRNDKYLGQAIRYNVADGKRSVKVTMKKRKGSGVIDETFNSMQLK
ncbi:hypothetical protein [Vibrio sp. 99-70-13A1]|uniref:hypothetical protein n=1 Tax=Vibrio sp. 99-70-13A1 TaxID=2607601 RepID=UPI001C10F2FE|nr:hypothetical protein [Vibrio sp. 99-70-13A1]